MSASTKALFLDVDGVLTSEHWARSRGARPSTPGLLRDAWLLDHNLTLRLQRVLNRTGAGIVLCSDWRLPEKGGYARARAALHHVGLVGPYLGATPTLTDAERLERFGAAEDGRLVRARWQECQVWLAQEGKGIEVWAVVDDLADFDAPGWRERRVQPDGDKGLSSEDAERLVALLGERE